MLMPTYDCYDLWTEQGEYKLKFFKDRYHGYGGSLRIETPDYVGVGPEFVKAAGELGYPSTDLNAPFSEGDWNKKQWASFICIGLSFQERSIH